MKYFKVVVEGIRHLPCGTLSPVHKHGKWVSGLQPYEGDTIIFSKEYVDDLLAQLEPIKQNFINHQKRCHGKLAITKVIIYNERLERLASSSILATVNGTLKGFELTIHPTAVPA